MLLLEDVEVVVERVERRLRRGVGELDRLEHLGLDLLADRGEVVVGDRAGLDQPPGEDLDRVAALPLLDLVLVAVDLGIGGRVAAVAIGERLDERRPPVAAGDLEVVGDALADRDDVLAVDPLAGDAEPLGLVREVGDRGVTLDRGAHPVEVVLDEEDDRQAPERRQVHRLAEVAGVRGSVAEHADGDVVGALVVGGEREAGGDREVAADDPVAAHEATVAVEDVHRPAAAAGGAVLAAEQLRHHVLRVGPARNRVSVGAVGADQVVVGGHHRRRPDDRRLLADREVEEAAGLGPLVLTTRLLLEAADQRHLPEQLPRRLAIGKLAAPRAVQDARRGPDLARLLLIGHSRSHYPSAFAASARGERPLPHPSALQSA